MAERISIRCAQLGDLEAIVQCETECFDSPWTYNMLYDDIIENDKTVYLVAELSGEIIGYAGMWVVLDEAHITNVCIKSGFRGRGYAKELMKAMRDISRVRGAFSMTLEVRVSNHSALKLYERCGFTVQGVRKKYYQNREDAYIMWTEREALTV